MTARATARTVRFAPPFRLDRIGPVRIPGLHEAAIAEEQTGDLTVQARQCISTSITIARDGSPPDQRIKPVDPDPRLLRNQGPPVLPTGEI